MNNSMLPRVSELEQHHQMQCPTQDASFYCHYIVVSANKALWSSWFVSLAYMTINTVVSLIFSQMCKIVAS